tara:strand:- start:855 stop:1217 length:363 start_codon:yes stop_codon:yes gene_type:complete
MNNEIGQKTLLSSSMLAAFTPMLCCWGPAVLASVTGVGGGIAAYFSWIHPARPYFFVFAFVSLGYSFYQAYKPKNSDAISCENCDTPKTNFFKSRLYLWLVAVFVATMFVINYYFPTLLI